MSSYKEALEIDFDNLDENWKNHSRDYMVWAEKWANAVAEKDKLKEKLKIVTAEIEMQTRIDFANNPPRNMKVTERLIAATLDVDVALIDLKEQVIEANREVDLYSSAKQAFEARKQALGGLTSLWTGGYFSVPNVSEKFREVANESISKKTTKAHKEELQKGNTRLKRRKLK
jgi:hypothetical protein